MTGTLRLGQPAIVDTVQGWQSGIIERIGAPVLGVRVVRLRLSYGPCIEALDTRVVPTAEWGRRVPADKDNG